MDGNQVTNKIIEYIVELNEQAEITKDIIYNIGDFRNRIDNFN